MGAVPSKNSSIVSPNFDVDGVNTFILLNKIISKLFGNNRFPLELTMKIMEYYYHFSRVRLLIGNGDFHYKNRDYHKCMLLFIVDTLTQSWIAFPATGDINDHFFIHSPVVNLCGFWDGRRCKDYKPTTMKPNGTKYITDSRTPLGGERKKFAFWCFWTRSENKLHYTSDRMNETSEGSFYQVDIGTDVSNNFSWVFRRRRNAKNEVISHDGILNTLTKI